MDVQLHVSAGRRQLLPRLHSHSHQVADAADVEHDEVVPGAPDDSTEMSDHSRAAPAAAGPKSLRATGVVAALAKRLLRAWHRAIAIASRAWSSSLPSGIFTCAASMRP